MADDLKLKLKVELLAKEAIAEATRFSTEVKRLAASAQAAAPSSADFSKTVDRLEGSLKKAALEAKVFGNETSGMKTQAGALKQAITDLITRGIDPEDKLLTKLIINYREAAKASEGLGSSSEGTASSMDELNKKLEFMGGAAAVAAIGRGIADLGEKALDTAGRHEMLRANLETLTGSAAAASHVFEGFKEFANVSPFNLEGVAKAGQQFMAAKVPMADVQTRLSQIGDLSLGNSQKFESMSMAFSKMSTKGKVDMEQLNIVLEAGVPILDELATGFGTNTEAVFEMMQKGQVSTADFIAAMERMTSQGGQFFGGMARGAKAYEGVMSTMRDSIDGAAASFGELMLPAAISVAKVVTGFMNMIEESPLLKGIIVGAVVALSVALVALSAKTWLAYAAEMALNAARAIANPLLLTGIVAAGLAAAGYVAYAASQKKAAEATEEASNVIKKSGSEMDAAKQSASEYTQLLDKMSEAELRNARASLNALIARNAGRAGTAAAIKDLTALDDRLKKLYESDDFKKAQTWKDDWATKSANVKLEASGNPYASVAADLGKTLFDAAANNVGKGGQKGIEEVVSNFAAKQDTLATVALKAIAGDNLEIYNQILEAYRKKREAVDASLARSEAERFAELSGLQTSMLEAKKATYSTTNKDSPELRAATELNFDKQIAEARVSDAKKVTDARAAIVVAAFDLANKERALEAELSEEKVDNLELAKERAIAIARAKGEETTAIELRYAKEIATAKIDDATKIFDLAHQKEAFESRLSETRVDDLEFERDRELALFQGTASDKAKLAEYYAKIIADTQVDEAEKTAEKELALAKKTFEKMRAEAAKSGDWVTYAAKTGEAKAAETEVGKMLGWGGKSAMSWEQVLIDSVLNIAMQNESVQKVLNIFSTALEGIVNWSLEPLADALTWLYDSVVVPVGNLIIDLVNGIIEKINTTLGTSLKKMESLQSSAEVEASKKRIAKNIEAIEDALADVREIFNEKKNELDDAYRKNIGSLRNLLELGALGEAEYATRVTQANAAYKASLESLEFVEKEQVTILGNILEQLRAGKDLSAQDIETAIKNALSDANAADASAATAAATSIEMEINTQIQAVAAAAEAARIATATTNAAELDGNAAANAVARLPVSPASIPPVVIPEIAAVWELEGNAAAALAARLIPNTIQAESTSSADSSDENRADKARGEFAVGTDELPYDMTARVHKGEMIVPRSFADGLRSGTITLGSGQRSGTTIVYKTELHVGGAIIAEDDLLEKIDKKLSRSRARGHSEAKS